MNDLDGDFDALEAAMSDGSEITRAFAQELSSLNATLNRTSYDMGTFEKGLSRGLRGAFDDLILDGATLSDALTGLAQKMADAAWSAAIDPVAKQLGSSIAGGISDLVGDVFGFADGGSFSQGRVMPFAKGGVVSQSTTFPMRGVTGLMGEAGPEAIMPLKRGPDGSLGVAAQGGGSVHVTMNISTPDVGGFQKSQSQVAAAMSRALSAGRRNG